MQDITMVTVLLDCSLNPRHTYNIAKFTLYYLGFPETRFKAPLSTGWVPDKLVELSISDKRGHG